MFACWVAEENPFKLKVLTNYCENTRNNPPKQRNSKRHIGLPKWHIALPERASQNLKSHMPC